jgi:hypothetical protein
LFPFFSLLFEPHRSLRCKTPKNHCIPYPGNGVI